MTARHVVAILAMTMSIVAGCSQANDHGVSAVPTVEPPGSPPSGFATDRLPTSIASAPGRIPSPTPVAEVASTDLPSRIVVEDLAIDLPIVSGDLIVAGNPIDYPLCDVAQYLTTYRFPGRSGTTTWIYGHARKGMFLPLLDASEESGGDSLIGMHVDLYTTGSRKYDYVITTVLRHAVDRTAAARVPTEGRRLIMQTSEGPSGTVPKLQVVAEIATSAPATSKAAMPEARPRGCS